MSERWTHRILAAAYQSFVRRKIGSHPRRVTSSRPGHTVRRNNHSYSPTHNSELPVSQRRAPLGCEWEQEYLERTHAGTRKTCRLRGWDLNRQPPFVVNSQNERQKNPAKHKTSQTTLLVASKTKSYASSEGKGAREQM